MTTIKVYFRVHKADADVGYVWISFWLNQERVNFSADIKTKVVSWDFNMR